MRYFWFKIYDTKEKTCKNHKIRSFLQNHKNPEDEIYAFCIIGFESIEILTHSSPQNDRLNLIGVKDIYIDYIDCRWRKIG